MKTAQMAIGSSFSSAPTRHRQNIRFHFIEWLARVFIFLHPSIVFSLSALLFIARDSRGVQHGVAVPPHSLSIEQRPDPLPSRRRTPSFANVAPRITALSPSRSRNEALATPSGRDHVLVLPACRRRRRSACGCLRLRRPRRAASPVLKNCSSL